MNFVDATIRWFDNLSGQGVVRVGNENIVVHYSAIDRHIPRNKEYYYKLLFSGQKVKVKIIRDSHYTQIEELI